jgi:cobalt-zinc-cadmium efflux system outer membrane protein
MQDSQTGACASVVRHRSARTPVPRVLAAALLLGTSGQVVRAEAPVAGPRPPRRYSPWIRRSPPLATVRRGSLRLPPTSALRQAGRTVAGLRPNPGCRSRLRMSAGQDGSGHPSATTTGFALPIELGGKRSALSQSRYTGNAIALRRCAPVTQWQGRGLRAHDQGFGFNR